MLREGAHLKRYKWAGAKLKWGGGRSVNDTTPVLSIYSNFTLTLHNSSDCGIYNEFAVNPRYFVKKQLRSPTFMHIRNKINSEINLSE